MGDKTQRSHIERVWYVDRDVSPGDSIPYRRLDSNEHVRYYDEKRDRYVTERGVPCTIIETTECGDYSGNALVGESNYRTLHKMCPWLVEIYGSHGYKALAYLGKRENQSDALIEAMDSLASYPLLDESDHSELECDRESECWSETYGGAHDFRKALVDHFDDTIDPDHEHEIDEDTIDAVIASCALPRRWYPEPISSLWDLWREGVEAFNVNGGSGYINEQGDSIYFLIDEWIKSASKPAYPTWSDGYKASHEAMRTNLIQIAHATRVKEQDNV